MKVLWQIETDFPIVTNIIFPIFVMMLYCNVTFCHPSSNSQACIWLRPCRIALLFSWFLITLASAVVQVNQILFLSYRLNFLNCIQPYGILTVFCPTSCPPLKIFPPKNVPEKKNGNKFVYCVAMVTCYIVIIYICVSISQVLIWGQLSYFHSCFVCFVRVCVCLRSLLSMRTSVE